MNEIVCLPIELDLVKTPEAIEIATEHNPANYIDLDVCNLPIGRIGLIKTSYWGPKGVDLGIRFISSVRSEVKQKILRYANLWGEHANVKFKEKTDGEVKIDFKRGGGYWSYLGTDILTINGNQPTMNLEGFDLDNLPDSEWSRVVCHEFGHTLGFPHEHMRKEIVDRIDPQKAYQYFSRNVGWNKQMVDSQVLTSLDERKILANKTRTTSIMCYQLPGSIMKDGIAVTGGNKIEQQDYEMCRKLYPKWS